MKKNRNKNKLFLIIILVAVFILALLLIKLSFTGNTALENNEGYSGPSQEDINCIYPCMTSYCPDLEPTCTAQYSSTCQQQCEVEAQPEETEEEACTSECMMQGCEVWEYDCQQTNLPECEVECGMILEPEAQNEEQACIQECVNAIDPTLICGASAEGETGGEVCQQCAAQCEYLYAGPCLGEEELEAMKAACVTCEHCYGEPLMGDSGEGWECIIDVECKDATNEFGDEPGVGEAITEAVSNTFEGIVNFFSGIFGNTEESTTEEKI